MYSSQFKCNFAVFFFFVCLFCYMADIPCMVCTRARNSTSTTLPDGTGSVCCMRQHWQFPNDDVSERNSPIESHAQ